MIYYWINVTLSLMKRTYRSYFGKSIFIECTFGIKWIRYFTYTVFLDVSYFYLWIVSHMNAWYWDKNDYKLKNAWYNW